MLDGEKIDKEAPEIVIFCSHNLSSRVQNSQADPTWQGLKDFFGTQFVNT